MHSNHKTWTSLINNALNGADQRIQYREVFFNLKAALVLAGWTREFTCNGITADTADNLPNAAAVVIGLSGTEPISYFVYSAPTNFPGTGHRMRICVWTNQLTADTTPQAAGIAISRGPYALAAGGLSLTTRPIAQYQERVHAATTNLIPWVALTAGTWGYTYSNAGDLAFYVKIDGNASIRMMTMISGKGAIDNGSQGAQIAHLFHANSTSSNIMTYAVMQIVSQWSSLDHSGGSTLVSTSLHSPLDTNSWTGGLDVNGDTDFFPAWIVNGAANFTQAIQFGWIPDVWTVPGSLPFGFTDPADTDAYRDTVVGAITLPFEFAQLPMI